MGAPIAIAETGSAARLECGTYGFAGCLVVLTLGSCALAGFAPLGFSIVTVFLFAGPHNWMEARFFFSRMPATWSRLKWYFLLGITGVLGLSLGSLLFPALARSGDWRWDDWLFAIAFWNTSLVLWIVAIAAYRHRESRAEKWLWMLPAGSALVAITWIHPLAWSLALVYLHPLVALWFLDRELGRRRPRWRSAYRRCLVLVPMLLGLLYWRLADAPHLPGKDLLTLQITHHAGAKLLSGVSSRFLVAAHTFLEMLHYAAWIVAIPLVGYAGLPWTLKKVPLAQRSRPWKAAIAGADDRCGNYVGVVGRLSGELSRDPRHLFQRRDSARTRRDPVSDADVLTHAECGRTLGISGGGVFDHDLPGNPRASRGPFKNSSPAPAISRRALADRLHLSHRSAGAAVLGVGAVRPRLVSCHSRDLRPACGMCAVLFRLPSSCPAHARVSRAGHGGDRTCQPDFISVLGNCPMALGMMPSRDSREPDCLFVDEGMNSFSPQFATVAGVFDAAEGDAGIGFDHLVDEHCTGFNVGDEFFRGGWI